MPDRLDAYLEDVHRTITQNGHAIQYVAGTPPWAYTIGLTDNDHPELITFGLAPRSSNLVLNQTATLLANGSITPSAPYRLSPEGAPLMLIKVRDEELTSEHFAVLRRFYDLHRITALQVVISDPQHRFPWDEDVTPDFKRAQRLLGDPPLPN